MPRNHCQFTHIFGIDQTGAKGSRPNSARPLPTCVVFQTGPTTWTARSGYLPALTRDQIQSWLAEVDPRYDLRHPPALALVVDCVLGLPVSHWPRSPNADTLWRIMRQTHSFSGFGREPAAAFFRTIDRLEAPGGLRRCEELTGAQSVFLEQPYQRNVQTGTFRIWKDLTAGGHRRWCHIWPFDEPATAENRTSWLFETYPRLLWQELFGLAKRDSAAIDHILKTLNSTGLTVILGSVDRQHIAADSNLADATVAAVGALLLQEQHRLFEPDPGFKVNRRARSEGWLIGLRSRRK